jgi:hypothetical protein
MNRKLRRTRAKTVKSAKKKYSLEDVQRALNIAMEIRKLTKGHLFSKNMKDRCVFCGATMKTKKMCDYWFVSFMDRLQVVLINPEHFRDNEIEALWIKSEDEYGNIKVPLSVPETGTVLPPPRKTRTFRKG